MGLAGDRCQRWVEREQQIKKWGEKERGRAYIVVVERNKKKKNERNEYFIEISYKIDKLMWVFCKNDGVKQKKQVLSVKQTESYAQADVIALTNRPKKTKK